MALAEEDEMRVALIVMLASVLGCTGSGDGDDSGPLELWAEAPETPPDGARRIEIEPTLVPAYAEQQMCFYLEPEASDAFLAHFDGYQVEGGHHLLLFRAVVHKEPGTIEDCTNPESMATLIPVISQAAELPEGMAVRVNARTQLVVQQHYVNTSDRDMLVHDVADIHFLEEAQVETLAGFFANTDISFALPPAQETTVSIHCTAPWDMNVLRISPHMHEHGARFQAHLERGNPGGDPIGEPVEPETLVDVPHWQPAMRDIAPAVSWGRDDALVLHAGDAFVTDCTFANDTPDEIGFPKEMCAISGYFFPALEGQASWICESGDDLDY